MLENLITDLESGFDPDPTFSNKELFRLDDLCRSAATEIRKLKSELDEIQSFIQSDPFKILSKVNVNEHIEKKNGLSYLSWAWAWDTLMRHYPDSEIGINRDPNGMPFWTDGHTAWVDVYVTLKYYGKERRRDELLPIMNNRNRSIPLEEITSFDINTALQRAWTKAIARHGLSFYIYAGEDLPKEEADQKKSPVTGEQVDRISQLYTVEEIQTMLKRMKKPEIWAITQEQAEKMIAKRDTGLVADQTTTF